MKKPANSILIDKEIIELANNFKLIDPFDENLLSGCSYDLRVGSKLTSRNRTTQIDLCKEAYTIESGECVTIETLETISFKDNHLFGVICNKHSILGQGLFHPITTVDPGYVGPLAITFIHWGHIPISIKEGQKICNIYFHYLSKAPHRIYGSIQTPSYQQGSTEFALIINQPEEREAYKSLKFKFGKPFSEITDKIETLEKRIDKLDGESELTYFKKQEERKKENKVRNRWIITILIAILGIVLSYVIFGGFKLGKEFEPSDKIETKKSVH